MDTQHIEIQPGTPPVCKAALGIFGQESGRWIPGRELADRLRLSDTRALRRDVIMPLRFRYRVPIHGRTGNDGGYKLAVTAVEHKQCCRAARQMGRDFFAIASVLRAESLEIVFAQMALEFLPHGKPAIVDSQDALSMLIDDQARHRRRVSWLDVVPHLLRVMSEKPDMYAEQIKQIGQEFGGVFLPPDRRRAIEDHLAAAQTLLSGRHEQPLRSPDAPGEQAACEHQAPADS